MPGAARPQAVVRAATSVFEPVAGPSQLLLADAFTGPEHNRLKPAGFLPCGERRLGASRGSALGGIALSLSV